MGIRKKIMLGFLCLGLMLAFSGMISAFELSKLSRNTHGLLSTSMKSMTFSRAMLDAVQEQNTSLLHMIVLGQTQFDTLFLSARTDFEAALANAARATADYDVTGIKTARSDYYTLVDDHFQTPGEKDILWFMEMYSTSYLNLTNAIKDYMLATQRSVLSRAEALESNAYRAITPGVITLCVAILIVLIFAFMVDTFYIKPLLRITKGLDGFLRYKLSYKVEAGGSDEITQLNDQVEELVGLARNKKTE